MDEEWTVCDQCCIVVTDMRDGSKIVFTLGGLSLNDEGFVDELVGSDDRGLGYRVALTVHRETLGHGHPET